MANIEDIEGVPGVFGGVKVDTPTNDATTIGGIGTENIENTAPVDGVFGGVQYNEQPNTIANVETNLPAKQGVWDKVKSVLFYDFNFKLTPYQQKIEDELNDFIFDKLSWSNFKNFLFKNASFGKNKDEE